MSAAGKRLVAIPMKDPRDAKTRLGLALTPEERGQLALSLFRVTVNRLREAIEGLGPQIDLAVVSASPTIREVAETLGRTGGNVSLFDPAALSPVLIVAGVDENFDRWLPLRADPDADCLAPIEMR